MLRNDKVIKNITKNTVIAKRCRVCSNFLSRGIGLMFKKKLVPTVLSFSRQNRQSIHTYFVKHYLDVIFLNDCWEVVDLKQGLEPKQVYKPKKNSMFVIEVSEGTIQKTKTEVGDIVHFRQHKL